MKRRRPKLPRLREKPLVMLLALVHMVALYAYGLQRWPGITLLVATVYLLVVLHCWPKEKR